jgi:hypothetical protein
MIMAATIAETANGPKLFVIVNALFDCGCDGGAGAV